MKRYCLEIYEPDSTQDVLYVLESDQPFLTVNIGDSINPAALSGAHSVVGPYTLRITGVEHILLDGAQVGHKVCIYTTRASQRSISDPDAAFSIKDRWIFAQLLRLLEAHNPAEASEFARHREALEEGYELHYSWLFEHFWEGLSTNECKEVLDILDMYRAIAYSAKGLDIKLDSLWFPFPGFDGNNETAQMAYARYFVNRLGRYGELEEQGVNTDFNSHMPTLDKYRSMLRVWNDGFGRSHELEAEQIQALLVA